MCFFLFFCVFLLWGFELNEWFRLYKRLKRQGAKNSEVLEDATSSKVSLDKTSSDIASGSDAPSEILHSCGSSWCVEDLSLLFLFFVLAVVCVYLVYYIILNLEKTIADYSGYFGLGVSFLNMVLNMDLFYKRIAKIFFYVILFLGMCLILYILLGSIILYTCVVLFIFFYFYVCV